jgi:hypothetical protein
MLIELVGIAKESFPSEIKRIQILINNEEMTAAMKFFYEDGGFREYFGAIDDDAIERIKQTSDFEWSEVE